MQAAADDEGPEAFFSLAALTAAAQASDDDAEEEEEEEGRSEGSDLDAAIREMETTGGASDADADEDAESDQQAEDGEQVCAASSPLIHPPPRVTCLCLAALLCERSGSSAIMFTTGVAPTWVWASWPGRAVTSPEAGSCR